MVAKNTKKVMTKIPKVRRTGQVLGASVLEERQILEEVKEVELFLAEKRYKAVEIKLGKPPKRQLAGDHPRDRPPQECSNPPCQNQLNGDSTVWRRIEGYWDLWFCHNCGVFKRSKGYMRSATAMADGKIWLGKRAKTLAKRAKYRINASDDDDGSSSEDDSEKEDEEKEDVEEEDVEQENVEEEDMEEEGEEEGEDVKDEDEEEEDVEEEDEDEEEDEEEENVGESCLDEPMEQSDSEFEVFQMKKKSSDFAPAKTRRTVARGPWIRAIRLEKFYSKCSLVLDVVFDAIGTPSVTWRGPNGRVLRDQGRIKISLKKVKNSPGMFHSECIILESSVADLGEYTCQIKDDNGTTTDQLYTGPPRRKMRRSAHIRRRQKTVIKESAIIHQEVEQGYQTIGNQDSNQKMPDGEEQAVEKEVAHQSFEKEDIEVPASRDQEMEKEVLEEEQQNCEEAMETDASKNQESEADEKENREKSVSVPEESEPIFEVDHVSEDHVLTTLETDQKVSEKTDHTCEIFAEEDYEEVEEMDDTLENEGSKADDQEENVGAFLDNNNGLFDSEFNDPEMTEDDSDVVWLEDVIAPESSHYPTPINQFVVMQPEEDQDADSENMCAELKNLSLPNLGNTCHMNVLLQAFSACPHLSEAVLEFLQEVSWFTEVYLKKRENERIDLLHTVLATLAKLACARLPFTENRNLIPTDNLKTSEKTLEKILRSVIFEGLDVDRQQDTFEVFERFRNFFEETFTRFLPEHRRFDPSEILKTKMECRRICSSCNWILESTAFSDIRVDAGTKPTTIAALLEERFQSKPDGRRCYCGAASFEETRILHMPAVLVISVERISGGSIKLNTSIDADPILDMTPYQQRQQEILDRAEYNLCAVIVHENKNQSAKSGHYVAYTRNRENEWLACSDIKIRKVTRRAMRNKTNKTSYMFFYSKKTSS